MRALGIEKFNKSFNFEDYKIKSHHARSNFLATGKLDDKIIPEYIADSWTRSLSTKVDPHKFMKSAFLDNQTYVLKKSKHIELVKLALPYMKDVYRSIMYSGYVVSLYSPEGYFLLRLGNIYNLKRAKDLMINNGLCLEERLVGTCGYSLSKYTKKPVYIIGCEHYTEPLQDVIGAYSPFFDQSKNDIGGVVSIAGIGKSPNIQTIGLAISLSSTIEKEISFRRSRNRVFFSGLKTTICSIQEPLMVLDSRGNFLGLNRSAKNALRIGNIEVEGKNISEISHLAPLKDILNNFLKNENKREVSCSIMGESYLIQANTIHKHPTYSHQPAIIMHIKSSSEHEDSGPKQRLYKDTRARSSERAFTFDQMIGSSILMQNIMRRALIVARSGANVIIEGESGTGKEVLAQSIHNASLRAQEAFIAVDSPSIPEELFESVLFGHEKGSFTGAAQLHIGKFESAHKGTIFLDEITEIPLSMQAKLLRVLEEKKIERVGGSKLIPNDVRVIAATNRNLLKEIQENRFRKDLFYRLKVFHIKLPPLRKRIEEIPEFISLFVQDIARGKDLKIPKISDEYLSIMMKHNWPGNIRELKNAVMYSMTFLDGPVLLASHLEGFFELLDDNECTEAKEDCSSSLNISAIEKKAILDALKITKGNKMKAAEMLGVSRATVHRKLKD